MTAESLENAQRQRLSLVGGIADAHLYVAKGLDPETRRKYRKEFYFMVKDWKTRENILSERTLPDLEKKVIWLNRGAWAAKSAKWGIDTITDMLSIYNEYEENRATLASTDLSEGTESAVMALNFTGKAISKVVDAVPIPLLSNTLKSYASLLTDAVKWAPAMDSLQSKRYQNTG